MTFYERYEALCRVRGIDPCSQSTVEKLGTTRSNVSYCKKGTKPNVEIVRNAANLLQTSADYLLGRTDDDTDYTVDQKRNRLCQRMLLLCFLGSTARTSKKL